MAPSLAEAWFKPASILEPFGPDIETQQRELRDFTEAGAGITRPPWKYAVGQILIGSEKWIESMRSVIEAKPRPDDHPAMQRYAARPRPGEIAEVVANVFETTPEQIRNSHGTLERRVVAWLGCYEGQSRLGAIGTVLRLRSTSRVSELIAECDHDARRQSANAPAHRNRPLSRSAAPRDATDPAALCGVLSRHRAARQLPTVSTSPAA